MGAALALILAGALAVDPVVKTDLGLAASAFARAEVPGTGAGPAGGLALVPSATTHVLRRDLTLELAYAPTLLADSDGQTVAARHALRLALKLPESSRLELAAKVKASYGKDELLIDPGDEAPFAFLSRMLPVIPDLLDTEADLSGSYQLSPTLRADASLGFEAFGGVSARSQRLIPLEIGPGLYLGLEHGLSPLSTLGATVYLSTSFISDERRMDSLQLAATFHQAVTRTLALSLSAGASADRSVDEGLARSSLSPALQAELEAKLPGRLSAWQLLFLGAYGPHTDPLTGELHDRIDASAVARLAVHERLTLQARVGAAREQDSAVERGASLAVAGADLGYAFPGGFSLGGGAQASIERASGIDSAVFWTVFTRAAWSLPDAL